MPEATLEVTLLIQTSQPGTAEVSLVRAALFGAVVPPLLGTAALILLRIDNWTAFPIPFSLLFVFVQMSLFVSVVCAPSGKAVDCYASIAGSSAGKSYR